MRRISAYCWIVLFFLSNHGLCTRLEAEFTKIHYELSCDPIDVVIPCAPKDKEILPLCIQSLQEHAHNIRHIFVISEKKFWQHKEAQWIPEKQFPFSKEDVAHEIFHADPDRVQPFLKTDRSRLGWIYQQLLKLYAPFVIPEISPNVLVVDADIVFLQPISFMNEKGEPLFATSIEYFPPYFSHMRRLLPGLKRVEEEESGIVHHMLFQKPILEDLFALITQHHQLPAWKAICHVVDEKWLSHACMSEYEIYFNFIRLRSDQAHIRPLRSLNIRSPKQIPKWKEQGYSFVALHDHLRSR
jgi:hypothetical protein